MRIPDFWVQIRVQRFRLGLRGDFGPNRTPRETRLDTYFGGLDPVDLLRIPDF